MKRLFVAAGVLAMHLCLLSNARADLLGYWPFEDAVENADGDLITGDASGNGNDGMVIDAEISPANNPILTSSQNALNVGDASNPGYVEIPIGEEFGNGFDSIVDTQSATITFWMNREGAAAHNQWTFIFDGGTSGSGAVDGRQLASHAPWSNGQIYFDTGGCCGANQRINTPLPEDVISGGDWHHLAFVRDVDDTAIYVE